MMMSSQLEEGGSIAREVEVSMSLQLLLPDLLLLLVTVLMFDFCSSVNCVFCVIMCGISSISPAVLGKVTELVQCQKFTYWSGIGRGRGRASNILGYGI